VATFYKIIHTDPNINRIQSNIASAVDRLSSDIEKNNQSFSIKRIEEDFFQNINEIREMIDRLNKRITDLENK